MSKNKKKSLNEKFAGKAEAPKEPRSSAEVSAEYNKLCQALGNSVIQHEMDKSKALFHFNELNAEMQRALQKETNNGQEARDIHAAEQAEANVPEHADPETAAAVEEVLASVAVESEVQDAQ